jgi:hypothetical protein
MLPLCARRRAARSSRSRWSYSIRRRRLPFSLRRRERGHQEEEGHELGVDAHGGCALQRPFQPAPPWFRALARDVAQAPCDGSDACHRDACDRGGAAHTQGMPTMASAIWHGSIHVLVALNGSDFPTNAEWQVYLRLGQQIIDETPPGGDLYALSFSDGGGPTAAQRRAAVTLIGDRTLYGALVTVSRLARGIGAIFNFLHPQFRVFAPRDLRRALAQVRVPDGEIPSLMAAVHAADEDMGLRCLHDVRALPLRGP